jgi:hypothetical protein
MGNIAECGDCGTFLAAIAPKPLRSDLICICTEPPSDAARIAGMSWGGVSETIRSACPLCQDDTGCPPQCRSLKPYGYADAPQWQKDVWDSALNQELRAMIPKVTVPRGGIKYPRFRVETMVVPKVRGWIWQKRTWNLHVRYWDPARQKNMHHIMEGFLTEALASNAEQIIKFAIKNINDQVQEERSAR